VIAFNNRILNFRNSLLPIVIVPLNLIDELMHNLLVVLLLLLLLLQIHESVLERSVFMFLLKEVAHALAECLFVQGAVLFQ
jgi:hypothetical protein